MRRPVYDYAHLPVPFPLVRAVLLGAPGTWLPEPALPHADGTIVTMRADGLLRAGGIDAIVEVGAPTIDRQKLLVRPITWRAANVEALFPILAADLEVEGINGSAARLALVGSYKPPVSVVGGAADRLIGHHVAEAVVRTFLEGLAERVANLADDGHTLGV